MWVLDVYGMWVWGCRVQTNGGREAGRQAGRQAGRPKGREHKQ